MEPLLLAPADSARAVGVAYNTSLLLLVPPALVVLGLAVMRSARGGGAALEVLLWRAAVLAMTTVTIGMILPAVWRIWVLPGVLATPLLSLGAAESGAGAGAWPQWLVAGWLAGATVVAARWGGAHWRLWRLARSATPTVDTRWQAAARLAAPRVPLPVAVAVVESDAVRVPCVVGVRRVRIVVPGADPFTPDERVAILVHERAHIAQGDALTLWLTQLLAIVHWYHPVVWFVGRRARRAMECAADDRVLSTGTRASAYAALLGLHTWPGRPGTAAVSLRGTSGGLLRHRLRRVASRHPQSVPTPWVRRVVLAAALGLSVPLGTVQLTPRRGVLADLMRDARWETRAFAVVRLAQRADTVAVALAAATEDPSPEVRAAARAALRRARRLSS